MQPPFTILANNFLFLLFTFPFFAVSQDTLYGKVLNKKTKDPLAYVQVGIPSHQAGTVSDENGKFRLIVRKGLSPKDTLLFRMMGFSSLKIPIGKNKHFTVYLEEEPYALEEVTVKPLKVKKITLGNKRYNKISQCFYSVSNEEGIKSGEAAIRANNKKNREVWLEEFHFYLKCNPKKDTIFFRVNFYQPDASDFPGSLLNKESIIFKVPPLKTGIIDVDLRKHNMHIKGDFFISLEVLSDFHREEQPCFSCSIIGPSYLRSNSFSSWEKFPVMGLDFNVDAVYFK